MGYLVKIPFRLIWMIVASCPLLAFFFCVSWSLLANFEESTKTHCNVPNYLPSISTAVGAFNPQKYVWRIGIAFHCTPRFLVTLMYYNYFRNNLLSESKWQSVVRILFYFQISEILSLVGLSYISSSEDFDTHKKLFVTFLITAIVSMSLVYTLIKFGVKNMQSRLERKSVHLKLVLLNVNCFAFVLSMYFYMRHNWYCEPGMYTLFAFAEYIVVLSNIGYHLTSMWDFSNQFIIVATA
ncbi:post-GPI attachment to proteins factor 2-like [Argiope bruennichi]|uniref:post-GPI attachment to proteins factor 2-like n=1 Tax=Argiope bruennichi TaxID=94029 RepID=UPI00249580D0|nr:post-GPI attachment to proteins factor 2-like [Argiope bruennichi]